MIKEQWIQVEKKIRNQLVNNCVYAPGPDKTAALAQRSQISN